MLKTISENKSLYATWLISMILIAAGVITTPLLSLAAFVICICFSLFSPSSDTISLLVGLIPCANVFKTSPGSTSLFTFFEIFVVLALILKSRKIKSGVFIPVALLAMYMLLFSANDLNVLFIIKMLIALIFIYYALPNISKADVVNITYMLSLAMLISLILSMNSTYSPYIEPYFQDINFLFDTSGKATDILRISGFIGDPNYSSIPILISLTLLCFLYYQKKINNFFWLLFVPLLILGFFSYSKSYFLCALMLIFFLIIFVLAPKHKGWAVISTMAIVVLGILAFSGKIELFNTTLERFIGNDVTSGRSDLNKAYLEYIFEDWKIFLFGDGIITEKFAGAANNVHNIYIELLYRFGLVGGVIYIVSLLTCCNSLSQKTFTKKQFINYMPILFIVVLYFFLAGISSYDLHFYIFLAMITINYEKLPKEKAIDPLIKLKH